MILADKDIKEYLSSKKLEIYPLFSDSVRENGVDLRIGKEFAEFNKKDYELNFDNIANNMIYIEDDHFTIFPNRHVLVTTLETIKMPDNLIAFCNLRSTFARMGLIIPPTIVDAGFEGQITIEILGSEMPITLRTGDRFLHLIFAETKSRVEHPYRGKYQNQKGVTFAKGDKK